MFSGAVYLLMRELWLQKTFPKVTFLNSNWPRSRYRIFRTEEEISELLEESTNIFQQNMPNRYIDWPNFNFQNGKYNVLDQMCF